MIRAALILTAAYASPAVATHEDPPPPRTDVVCYTGIITPSSVSWRCRDRITGERWRCVRIGERTRCWDSPPAPPEEPRR